MTGKKTVSMKVDGIDPVQRELFKQIMGCTSKSRGEVFSELMKEFAEKTIGKEAVAREIQEIEERLALKASNTSGQEDNLGSEQDANSLKHNEL